MVEDDFLRDRRENGEVSRVDEDDVELSNDPGDRLLGWIDLWWLLRIPNNVLDHVQLILRQVLQNDLLLVVVVINLYLELEVGETELKFMVPAEAKRLCILNFLLVVVEDLKGDWLGLVGVV